MGLKSRRKGKSFELVVRSRVQDYFPTITVRRSSQAERAYEADLILEGPTCPPWLSQLWIECEHANQVNALAKLEQGEHDAFEWAKRMGTNSRLPIACTRETGRRVINATTRLVTLTQLVMPQHEVWLPHDDSAMLVVTLPLDELLADLARRKC
jgi:hypothetical protein